MTIASAMTATAATTISGSRERRSGAGSALCMKARNCCVFPLGSMWFSDMRLTLAVTTNSTRHMHVRVLGRRHECFLDDARRHPTHQVVPRAGLVVGTRRACVSVQL